jgi:hypothetical protein
MALSTGAPTRAGARAKSAAASCAGSASSTSAACAGCVRMNAKLSVSASAIARLGEQ